MKTPLIQAGLGILALTTTSVAWADLPSTHGMVLFGKEKVYASHLPMFHAPHDYQAVFEISIHDLPRGNPVVDVYQNSVGADGKHGLFTLVPEPMDLSEVIALKKTSFNARIFKGHFEQGGTPIGTAAVNVSKVIFSQKLTRDSEPNSDFIVFGSGQEFFATKKIGAVGSYDAVVSVSHPVVFTPGPCPSRLCGALWPWDLEESELPIVLPARSGAVSNETSGETPNFSFQIPTDTDTLSNEGTNSSHSYAKAEINEVIYGSGDDLQH